MPSYLVREPCVSHADLDTEVRQITHRIFIARLQLLYQENV
jgi:hypothetical protein